VFHGFPLLGSNKNPYLNAYSFTNSVRKVGKILARLNSMIDILSGRLLLHKPDILPCLILPLCYRFVEGMGGVNNTLHHLKSEYCGASLSRREEWRET
jgi:hypothetical protein